MASLEDKIDRYYDDLFGKVKSLIELQQRFLGEQKDLKKEVSRLREVVIQLEADVQSALVKMKASPSAEHSVASVAPESRGAPPAEPPKVASAPEAVPDAAPEAPAKQPKTLKEYLADGVSLYDVKVLNAFIKAAKEVIKANCRKEPAFVKPRIEENMVLPVFVVGKMKLSRDGGQGAMALAFTRECMEVVARDVLFLPPDAQISEGDGKDVTSELCNQVCGRSKIMLRAEGYNFDISVPTVTADAVPAALFKSVGGVPKMALAFQYEKFPFYVLFWG